MYAGASSFSRQLDRGRVERRRRTAIRPRSRARSKIGSCHSHGVCASLVELVEVRVAPQLVLRRRSGTPGCPRRGSSCRRCRSAASGACAPGLGQRLDDVQRPVEVAVVVARHLRDRRTAGGPGRPGTPPILDGVLSSDQPTWHSGARRSASCRRPAHMSSKRASRCMSTQSPSRRSGRGAGPPPTKPKCAYMVTPPGVKRQRLAAELVEAQPAEGVLAQQVLHRAVPTPRPRVEGSAR